jgi:hypothetical protein
LIIVAEVQDAVLVRYSRSGSAFGALVNLVPISILFIVVASNALGVSVLSGI